MAEGLESFTFYPSFYEAINEIPDVETRYELLMAIMEYGNHGREIELKSYVARAIFKTIKPNLDAEKERKVNGKKGGRPSQEKENYSSAKEKTTLSEPAKAIKNENKNENENYKTINTYAPESHDAVALSTAEPKQPKRDLQQQRFDAFWQAYPKKVGKLHLEDGYDCPKVLVRMDGQSIEVGDRIRTLQRNLTLAAALVKRWQKCGSRNDGRIKGEFVTICRNGQEWRKSG